MYNDFQNKTREWKNFILYILDGKYELDIEKTGSIQMFVKNQLSSVKFINLEKQRFDEALLEIIKDLKFTREDYFYQPNVYLVLIDLCKEFLGSHIYFLTSCASIFASVYEQADDLSENGTRLKELILNKTSYVLVKFIGEWKIRYQALYKDINLLYKQYDFLTGLKEFWLMVWKNDSTLKYPNVLIGILYLDDWKNIAFESRIKFLKENKENLDAFIPLLNDMRRLKGNKLFNYFSFSNDCIVHFKVFYSFIKSRTKYISDLNVMNDLRMQEHYKQHMFNIQPDLLESFRISEPYQTTEENRDFNEN